MTATAAEARKTAAAETAAAAEAKAETAAAEIKQTDNRAALLLRRKRNVCR